MTEKSAKNNNFFMQFKRYMSKETQLNLQKLRSNLHKLQLCAPPPPPGPPPPPRVPMRRISSLSHPSLCPKGPVGYHQPQIRKGADQDSLRPLMNLEPPEQDVHRLLHPLILINVKKNHERPDQSPPEPKNNKRRRRRNGRDGSRLILHTLTAMTGLIPGRRLLLLLLLWTLTTVADGGGGGRRRGGGGGVEKRRKLHHIQHGQCSYTFVLPELDGCPGGGSPYGGAASVVQRDSPPLDGEWSAQKLQLLENTMENNTQWLQKLENVIQRSVKPDVTNTPSHIVHNQTATMLEIGTNLLTHTAEQTRKLNVVEAKVLNHTSRIEIQLLENSLSTNKLEKELLLQTSEISRLRDKNSRLENKVQMLESQQKGELEDMKQEKSRLQSVVRTQMAAIESLEVQLRLASSNNTALQRQQAQLMESVHTLINMVASTTASPSRDHMWRDCADVYKAGHSVSGLYDIYFSNRTEPVQVFCDMETSGGGWTVFQRRFNGSVNFQRSWREYKMGFGDALGEHWLGNEAIHLLTSQGQYSLRVELRDWDGNPAHSQYDRFTLTNERQQYRLYLRGYSGTAGRQSSLSTHGTRFSTRDQDNDNCEHCKCALMLTGGWWFDACGFSNLNGIYYNVGHNIRKLNGIKWHHFRGPSYSLRSTAMMVRPYDF